MERWLKDLAQLSTYWQAWFLRELNYPSIWESFGRRQRRKAYFRMPCLWIVSYFPVGLCLYLESVTVWHICKLLISWLAFSSCKSKGFSRLRWGMCMTTLCSSRPWHVLHYHGGRGLSEESSLEARALRGRKAGCCCWALEDSDFNLRVVFLFFLALSFSELALQGTRDWTASCHTEASWPSLLHLPFICQQLFSQNPERSLVCSRRRESVLFRPWKGKVPPRDFTFLLPSISYFSLEHTVLHNNSVQNPCSSQ